MYYAYLLRSEKDRKWYIGYTSNLRRRLQDHNQGRNKSTASRGKLALIYYEAYLHKMDALGREKFLKSGSGHKYLSKALENLLIFMPHG